MFNNVAVRLGAADTPTKSIVKRISTQGLGAIEEDKQMKRKEKERHRQAAEKHRQAQELERIQMVNALEGERAKRAEDTNRQEQEKAAIIRMAEEHLKQETQARLKKHEELEKLRLVLKQKEQEVSKAQKELSSAEDQIRTLLKKIDSHGTTSTTVTSTQMHTEANQREIEELQRLLEKERAKKREECEAEILEQLKVMQQERDDLLNLLNTLRGGQALTLSQDNFTKYCDFHIHDSELKPVDTSFNATKQIKLEAIKSSIEALDETIADDTKLKAVQKMVTRRQLSGVLEAAKDFEMNAFARAFSEAQQSPYLANSEAFKEIEEMMKWFKEKEKDLVQIGEHRVYVERQQQLRKLFEENYSEFANFYGDYLDQVIVNDLVWLLPSSNDDEPTKNAKQILLPEVHTGSLTKLRDHVYGKVPIYGDSNVFYSRTFVRYIKEYDALKKVIDTYAGLFRGLGEYAKLMEDLLNYRFFQLRCMACFDKIKVIDLQKINDTTVRDILKEIQSGKVLSYSETKVTLFATKVDQACKEYLSKKAVMRPEENLMESLVRKTLISYQLLHAYAQKLRAANPKLPQFHHKRHDK
jgi:hypothetical protein